MAKTKTIGGSSAAIRGDKKFEVTTPDDYTFEGQRFLRAGSIEDNQSLFDVSVWNVRNLLPTTTVSHNYNASDNAGYSFSNSSYIFAGFSGAAWVLVSSDDGLTFTRKDNMLNSFKGNFIEFQGKVCWPILNANNVSYTTDGGDSITTQANGGANVNEYLVTDGATLVAGLNGTTWRYTTDANLVTWADCTGTMVALLDGENYDQMAHGNGVFVASPPTGTSSDNAYYSADGQAWIESANVFGTASHLSGGVMFDTSANLFRKFGEVSANSFKMWTSSDGMNWSNAIDVEFPEAQFGYNLKNLSDGRLVCTELGGGVFTSEDSGATWRQVPSSVGLSSAVTSASYVLTNGGDVVLYNEDVELFCNYDLYAGTYYPLVSGDDWQNEQNQKTFTRIK